MVMFLNYILKLNRKKANLFIFNVKLHYQSSVKTQINGNSYHYFGGTPEIELQSRILNYLRNKLDIKNTIVSTLLGEKIERNAKLSTNELKTIDNKLCNHISTMGIKERLNNINDLMKYTPDKIRYTNFYRNTMRLNISKLSNEELIQYIYYISIEKRNKNVQQILYTTIMNLSNNYIQQLSLEDYCLICLSAFKTSTFIDNMHFLSRLDKFFLNENNIFKDDHVFIILIKCMRHNRYHSADLLKLISNNINKKNVDKFSFCVNSHVLALFGTASYFENTLLTKITNNCMKELKENNNNIRTKDVGTFVWAISFLGFNEMDKNEFESLITNHVMNNLESYKQKSQILLDIVLSLWMLEIKSEILVKQITPDVIKLIAGMDRYRYNSRLNLLLTCIESDKNFKSDILHNVKPFNKVPPRQKYRESICKIKTILTKLLPKELDARIIINYQIPNINFEGITIYKNSTKLLEIEAFDSIVCLQNTIQTTPNGIMKLKNDLLKNNECPVITVDCLNLSSISQLEMDLRNKLKLYIPINQLI